MRCGLTKANWDVGEGPLGKGLRECLANVLVLVHPVVAQKILLAPKHFEHVVVWAVGPLQLAHVLGADQISNDLTWGEVHIALDTGNRTHAKQTGEGGKKVKKKRKRKKKKEETKKGKGKTEWVPALTILHTDRHTDTQTHIRTHTDTHGHILPLCLDLLRTYVLSCASLRRILQRKNVLFCRRFWMCTGSGVLTMLGGNRCSAYPSFPAWSRADATSCFTHTHTHTRMHRERKVAHNCEKEHALVCTNQDEGRRGKGKTQRQKPCCRCNAHSKRSGCFGGRL